MPLCRSYILKIFYPFIYTNGIVTNVVIPPKFYKVIKIKYLYLCCYAAHMFLKYYTHLFILIGLLCLIL
jgi:hypothetical protein